MSKDRNDQVDIDFNLMEFTRAKGRRELIFTTPSSFTMKGGMAQNIFMPTIDDSTVVDPDTIELEFKFKSANNKSWFKNNLAKLLTSNIQVTIAGKTVYTATEEGALGVYKDLCKSDQEREDMICYDIANEDMRKLWSGFSPAPTDADAVLLTSKTPRLRLKLDRTFSGNGSFYPYGLGNLMFRVTLPKPEDVMVAATGSKVEGYTLEDVTLRFETITCMSLRDEDNPERSGTNLARVASRRYESGKEIFFKQPFQQLEEVWSKSMLNCQINAPIKMLNAVVLLFQEVDSKDSEKFVSANIERVEIDLESRHMLRKDGLREQDLYEEARRLFGKKDCLDRMTKKKFETDAYALVLDFRTINQNDVIASRIKLSGTQNGLKIKVEKRATAKDLKVSIYTLADSSFFIQNGLATGLKY